MIYAGIDVNIITHAKAMAAGMEAFGLWCWGMCWSQLHESDGQLPRAVILQALGGRRNIMLAKRLVEVGLWVENDDGSWSVWNYAKKNQTSDCIKAKRDAAAARVKAWRERVSNADVTRYTGVSVTRNERVRTDPSPEPSPPPEPVKINSTTAPPAASPKMRGVRLPDGWRPSESTQQWARLQGVADPLAELENFHDYWRGIPGARGVKLDWDATYRNRLRQVAALAVTRRPIPAPVSEVKPLPSVEPLMRERERWERDAATPEQTAQAAANLSKLLGRVGT